MTFLPEEVEAQEFLTAIRGYDKQAVRRFLTVLANQIREHESELVSLQQEIAALRGESASEVDAGDIVRVAAELRSQLAVAERLVEDLRTWREPPRSEPQRPRAPAPKVPDEPAPPPRAGVREASSPPPEWEELFVDPTEGRE